MRTCESCGARHGIDEGCMLVINGTYLCGRCVANLHKQQTDSLIAKVKEANK